VPAGLVLVVLTAVTEVVSYNSGARPRWGWRSASTRRWWLHVAFFAVAGLLPLARSLARLQNIRVTGDRVDLTNW